MLIPNFAGFVSYEEVQYAGSFAVTGETPEQRSEVVREQLQAFQVERETPVVLLISLSGIKICSTDGKAVHMAHALRRVSYACSEPSRQQFCFLSRSPRGSSKYQHCHVFVTNSAEQADDLNAVIGKAFLIAYTQSKQAPRTANAFPTFQKMIEQQIENNKRREREEEERRQQELQQRLTDISSPTLSGGLSGRGRHHLEQRRNRRLQENNSVWVRKPLLRQNSTGTAIPPDCFYGVTGTGEKLARHHSHDATPSSQTLHHRQHPDAQLHSTNQLPQTQTLPHKPANERTRHQSAPHELTNQHSNNQAHTCTSANQQIETQTAQHLSQQQNLSPSENVHNVSQDSGVACNWTAQWVQQHCQDQANASFDSALQSPTEKFVSPYMVTDLCEKELKMGIMADDIPAKGKKGSLVTHLKETIDKGFSRQSPTAVYLYPDVDTLFCEDMLQPTFHSDALLDMSKRPLPPLPPRNSTMGSNTRGRGIPNDVRERESPLTTPCERLRIQATVHRTESGRSPTRSDQPAPALANESCDSGISSPPRPPAIPARLLSPSEYRPDSRASSSGQSSCSDPSGCSAESMRYLNESPGLAHEKFSLTSDLDDDPTLQFAPWYQAGIPREVALEVLHQQPIGSFIVRLSGTQRNCLALSVKVPKYDNPSGISHYLIVRCEGGYRLKGLTKEWQTLRALVIHLSVLPEMLPCPLRLPRDLNNAGYAGQESQDGTWTEEDEDYQKLADCSALMAELRGEGLEDEE